MEHVSHNARLVRQAYWLIRLRWIAIAGTCVTTFAAYNTLNIPVRQIPLYCVCGALALENVASLLLLKHALKTRVTTVFVTVRRIIDFQIAADLLALTILLHYSGGIENPFIIYFIFHMAIASILLSMRESYLHATYAMGLIILLAFLEYKGIIRHYCLEGFVANDFHKDALHVFGVIGVLASALYLTVYMTGNIAVQLRKQEEAYCQANIMLEQKDRIKDEYVARVTHDIKGHLAAIQSCLDVVVSPSTTLSREKRTHFVNRAHSRTKKLTYFVQTLLNLTRLRLSHEVVMTVFSLKNTINNALASVKARADDKSIELHCDIEPGVDKVVGNQFSIEEVIMNLLFNAIKYTLEKGVIKVTAGNQQNCIRVGISDTGIGIPHDEIPRIFDEFYRASNARKTLQDGSGLGLSIVKQIIDRHGGKIWADSEENNGTTFWFTLPKEINNQVDATDLD